MSFEHINSISDTNYRLFDLRKSLYFANIWMHKSKNVILIEYKSNFLIDTKEANIIIEEVFNFAKTDSKAISDVRTENHLVTEEAKSLLASNKVLRAISKKAVVLESLPSRINTNHFIKAHKPIIPFKYFDSITEALKWLEEDN